MKMRTISEAYNKLKNTDPETAITLSGLRRLVNNGAVPSVKIGRRILVNYDGMVEYLSNPPAEHKEDVQYGQVRQIKSN